MPKQPLWETDKLLHLYADGLSTFQIAQQVGMPLLEEFGVQSTQVRQAPSFLLEKASGALEAPDHLYTENLWLSSWECYS
jgi:hypothetical protein